MDKIRFERGAPTGAAKDDSVAVIVRPMAPNGTKAGAATAMSVRHVSAEGCQLVMDLETYRPGEELAFVLAGWPPVPGKIRWIVDDRIGFAFEHPICAAAERALTNAARLGQPVSVSRA